MSDARDLAARLIEAGRRDVAPNQTEREAKIYAGVLAAAAAGPDGGGGGDASVLRSLGAWGRIALMGVGALAVVGTGSLVLTRASDTRTDLPNGPAAVATIAPSWPVQTPTEQPKVEESSTSVWALPSVVTPKKNGPADESDTLSAELAMLEAIRATIRARDSRAAMLGLSEFDRRFPHPRAADEATVLRVEVLAASGKADEARRVGRAFLEGHPDSIYRARIALVMGDRQ